MGIKAGSKLFLDTVNTRTGIAGNNYIQSGTPLTSEDLGNIFSRDFTNLTVGGRNMLILDENGSGSRILGGTNGNKVSIEAKTFYVSNSYGSAPGYNKIVSNDATSMSLFVGDADNTFHVYLLENGGGANDYIAFPALSKIFLDGGNNTYIQESSADHISMVAGGVTTFVLDNTSAKIGANQYMTLTDNEIDISSGDLTLDVAGDIVLSADGDHITMNDGTTKTFDFALDATPRLAVTGNFELAGSAAVEISSASHMSLDSEGGIVLDSGGTFKASKNGTEFSATDSAYAGMVLGYTRIANNNTSAGRDIITVNSSSMTVLQTAGGTDLSIQFIVPPSGSVEISCSFWMLASSDGAKFSLSTGTSYAELNETHTYDGDDTIFYDETDHNMHTIRFAVTGLTANTDTTYYLAALASGAGVSIKHGRFRTTGTHHPPIILKAVALPATIVTGE